MYEHSLEIAGFRLHILGCEWDIIDKISYPQSRLKLNHLAYSQPICTALEVTPMNPLASWDLSSTTVIGHPSGEIAAAYPAGAFSHDSAGFLAYHRGTVAALYKSSVFEREI